MTDTGLELGASELDHSVGGFAKENQDYYTGEFEKIQGTTGFPWSWNTMAAVVGPLWGAWRGVWGHFWTFLVLELFAFVQLGRGLWGELGADQLAKVERLTANIAKREQQAKEAVAAGDQAAADGALKIAENLKKVVVSAQEAADKAAGEATTILLTGIVLLIAVKVIEGFYANMAYEKQYLAWRANPEKVQAGPNTGSAIFGGILLIAIWPLTLFRFTVTDPDKILSSLTGGFLGGSLPITEFPVKKEYYASWAKKGDAGFDYLANEFGTVFNGVTATIRAVLDFLEIILIQTP